METTFPVSENQKIHVKSEWICSAQEEGPEYSTWKSLDASNLRSE